MPKITDNVYAAPEFLERLAFSQVRPDENQRQRTEPLFGQTTIPNPKEQVYNMVSHITCPS